jgi:hypothetical protein
MGEGILTGFFQPLEDVLSEWHICQGCGNSFTADKLFKGDDGKFYCDDCLGIIEDDKKER